MEPKKPQISLRLPQELANKVKECADREGSTLNSFISYTLHEKTEQGTLCRAVSDHNALLIKKATLDLMLEWNDKVKETQEPLSPYILNENRRLELLQRAWKIYTDPEYGEIDIRGACVSLLNLLDGICYGFLSGCLDNEAESTFPIEFYGEELLLPIQAAFHKKHGIPGWPQVEKYLRAKQGEKVFDDKLSKCMANLG